MKFFLDSADTTKIAELSETGLVDGITTNPSLIAKSGRNILTVAAELCDLIPGPISIEVGAQEKSAMIAEGRKLASIAENICVKLPMTWEGIAACKTLSTEGIKVNMTLVFHPVQALLAAKAGAYFVSPFVGRLDDIGQDGMDLVASLVEIYGNYPAYQTQILVASIRGAMHVVQAAEMGADAVTLPPDLFSALARHPLSDQGLDAFLRDWQKTGQSIL